jgi:hypothetical protein
MEGEMPTEPTPEESARHLLDIFFQSDKLHAGRNLIRGPARVEFLKDRQWHTKDFVAGLQHAAQNHWIAIPSPNLIKLTEDGFHAYKALEMPPLMSPGGGKGS